MDNFLYVNMIYLFSIHMPKKLLNLILCKIIVEIKIDLLLKWIPYYDVGLKTAVNQ